MSYDEYDRFAPVDENDWYYFVRIDTNDILLNKAGERNVCKEFHIDRMLNHLNQYETIWEAMTIAQYKRKFGDV